MAIDKREELDNIRRALDDLDNQLIRILARRFEIGREAARVKHDLGIPVHDPPREDRVIAQAAAWAKEAGLPEDEVEDIFRRLVRISRNAQSVSSSE